MGKYMKSWNGYEVVDEKARKDIEKLDINTNIHLDNIEEKYDESLLTKLTAPQTAKVGQIFRVQEVNEDGTLTLEAVDMPECDVTDVTVNGTSIVGEDGVAIVPIAKSEHHGVTMARGGLEGISVSETSGALGLVRASKELIKKRNPYSQNPICPGEIDYTVEAAMGAPIGNGMIDGVFHYPAWSEETQAAARKRIGIGDYELIEEINVDSDCVIDRYQDLNGVNYDFKKMYMFIQFPSISSSGMLYIRYYRDSNYYVYDKLLGLFTISNSTGENKTFRGEVIVNDIFVFMNGIGKYTSIGIYNDNNYMAEPGSGETNTIKSLRIGDNSSLIPSGTVVRIYGVRA